MSSAEANPSSSEASESSELPTIALEVVRGEEMLLELAVGLGITTRYDLLIISDGSGMRADVPCGWSALAFEPNQPTGQRLKVHYGGATGGTNNYAELAPFIHALWAYHTERWQSVLRKISPKVILISDSELTVKCGRGEYARNCNLALWASIDWFVERGYRLYWSHVRRNSSRAHRWVDDTGRKIRWMIENTKKQP